MPAKHKKRARPKASIVELVNKYPKFLLMYHEIPLPGNRRGICFYKQPYEYELLNALWYNDILHKLNATLLKTLHHQGARRAPDT